MSSRRDKRLAAIRAAMPDHAGITSGEWLRLLDAYHVVCGMGNTASIEEVKQEGVDLLALSE